MMRAILVLLVFPAAWPARAQSAAMPEFEVASIKPSPARDGGGISIGCRGGPGTKDPTLFTCQNMPLSQLVCEAYSIPMYRLTAPDWAGQAMFHVNARVPEGATKEQFSAMLQRLLAERFKLAVHRESKEIAQYELTPGKNGTRFKPAGEPPASKDGAPAGPLRADKDGYPAPPVGRPGMWMMNGHARVYNPAYTMPMLADMLASWLGKPVTDATGLTGKYEISLYWIAKPPSAAAPGDGASEPDGPSLVQAVQEQLGLRLELKKAPVDIVVIDHAEKTPVENWPLFI